MFLHFLMSRLGPRLLIDTISPKDISSTHSNVDQTDSQPYDGVRGLKFTILAKIGKMPFGQMSIGKVSVGQMSVGQ